jgi:DNA-binding transcriptional LysR family regulator
MTRSVNLDHVRIFLSIAELNSFTKAAGAFGVSQPTISRIIQELEETWGGELFYRTGRGANLSELGHAAVERARDLLQNADQISEELRTYGRLPSGTVSLGVSPALLPPVLPELFNHLKRDLPGIRLIVREGFSDQIERLRLSGLVDIGLYSRFREGISGNSKSLVVSGMVLAAARDAPPLPATVPFASLPDYPLVMPAQPHKLRMLFESISRRLGITLNIALETDSLIAQKQACERCGCYMIKSPEAIAEESGKGFYSTSLIVNPTVHSSIVLVTTQQHPLSRAAREVSKRLTAILKSLNRE